MANKTDDTPGSYSTLDPLTFQADRHTDLWIARRVMEWPDVKESDPLHDYFHFGGVIMGGNRPISFRYGTISDLFQPSSKIEDAVQVLRMMKTKGWFYVIRGDPKTKSTRVIFGRDKKVEGVDLFASEADTESLAICRAAGSAVISEEK